MELFYVLVYNSQNESILANHASRTLPTLYTDRQSPSILETFCNHIKETIGADFDVVRLREECETRNANSFHWTLQIFEVVDTDAPEAPPGFVWVPRDKYGSVGIDPVSDPVSKFLQQFAKVGLKAGRKRLAPYFLPGWFTRACSWIRSALKEYENSEVNLFEQRRSSFESYVMRVDAVAEGISSCFYFKALCRATIEWRDEASITAALAAELPEHFAQPVAYDIEERWLLMGDYGTPQHWSTCTFKLEPALCRRMLMAWAEVQKKSIAMTARLVSHGVPLLDVASIREVSNVINHPEWFAAQQQGMKEESWRSRRTTAELESDDALTHQEYSTELMGEVDVILERWSNCDCNIPMTIVHGDLNVMNIIVDADEKEKITFIDFAYTLVSHPFIDFAYFVSSVEAEDGDMEDYLRLWMEYVEGEDEDAKLEKLRSAARIANALLRLVGILYSFEWFMAGRSERSREEMEMPVRKRLKSLAEEEF